MTLNEYQEHALRTAPERTNPGEDNKLDLLHAAMGLCTEAGELMDSLKKNRFYGRQLDIANIIEEAGDALWYISLVSRATGISMEEIAEINIRKLAKRYPQKFDVVRAVHRDLPAEREILDNGVQQSTD